MRYERYRETWARTGALPSRDGAYSYRAPRAGPGACRRCNEAPVAQLDRAPDYESGGQEFESLRARHFGTKLGTPKPTVFALETATSVRSSTLFDPMMRTSFASTSTR